MDVATVLAGLYARRRATMLAAEDTYRWVLGRRYAYLMGDDPEGVWLVSVWVVDTFIATDLLATSTAALVFCGTASPR